MKSIALELIGQRFGRLIVLKRVKNDKWDKARWLCECDCGSLRMIVGSDLKRGATRSCGCLRKETASKLNTTHGATIGIRPKIYEVWRSMRERCYNPKHKAYKNYGGRGITVCKRWSKFENFLEDMGEVPEGLTIERKDNDKGYTPDNCKWATRLEQRRNSRGTKLNPLRVKNIKQCLRKGGLTRKTLGYIFGVSTSAINHIANGRTWSDIVYTPRTN